jgi:CheY-like chemotaxis protein
MVIEPEIQDSREEPRMAANSILLVEDNPDDEALTLRAFRKNNVTNEVVVARDGAEALDYLFGTGTYANRDVTLLPQIVILDLKLPKIDGLEVLRRMRAAPQTKLLPVVILTSSNEERDLLEGYGLGANSYVRKPVDFAEFLDAVRQLGLYWLLLNERPPLVRKN